MMFAVSASHGSFDSRTFAPNFSTDPFALPSHGRHSAGWTYYYQATRRPRRHTKAAEASDLQFAAVRSILLAFTARARAPDDVLAFLLAHMHVPQPLLEPFGLLVDHRRGGDSRLRDGRASVRSFLRPLLWSRLLSLADISSTFSFVLEAGSVKMQSRTTFFDEGSGVSLPISNSHLSAQGADSLAGLFVLDSQLSAGLGRAPHIAPSTFDAPLPVQIATNAREDLTAFYYCIKLSHLVRTTTSSLVRFSPSNSRLLSSGVPG